jgi:hypothetical protein
MMCAATFPKPAHSHCHHPGHHCGNNNPGMIVFVPALNDDNTLMGRLTMMLLEVILKSGRTISAFWLLNTPTEGLWDSDKV